jgi:hypothetical protein
VETKKNVKKQGNVSTLNIHNSSIIESKDIEMVEMIKNSNIVIRLQGLKEESNKEMTEVKN